MMNETFDKATAEHLAAVIHAIRDDWDERGIVAALGELRTKPLWQVVVAAALAAHNPAARTPAVIALQGDHWRDLRQATASPADRHPASAPFNELCDICGREKLHCDQLDTGHDYRPRTAHRRMSAYEAGATKARAELAMSLASEAAATVRLDHDPDAGTHVIDGVVQPLPETTDNESETP